MDTLTRDAVAARQAGMSYGQYKAMQPRVVTERLDPEKFGRCRKCGEVFEKVNGKRFYCSRKCCDSYRRVRNREHMRENRNKCKED